jgi:hypothetical protein
MPGETQTLLDELASKRASLPEPFIGALAHAIMVSSNDDVLFLSPSPDEATLCDVVFDIVMGTPYQRVGERAARLLHILEMLAQATTRRLRVSLFSVSESVRFAAYAGYWDKRLADA